MIVGFLGKSGSGKDTAADFLCSHGFVLIAFADAIKRIAREVWDFSDEQLWGPQSIKNAPDERYQTPTGAVSPRAALQFLGTEVGRGIWPDTWASYTLRVARKVLAGTHCYDSRKGAAYSMPSYPPIGVVISDVRFANEVRLIHDAGGVVVRLNRAGVGGDIIGGLVRHLSETEMDSIREVDATIQVPEGIAEFHLELHATLRRIPKLSAIIGQE